MKFRSTYIMVAVALVMGLFIYFYEIRGAKHREEEKGRETKVFNVKEDQINWIEISRPKGEPLRVEKVDAGGVKTWRIVKPLETRADEGAVGSITWQLADLSFTQVAQDSAADLAPYGLNTPELTLRFGAGGGEFSVSFGGKLAVGSDSYAMANGQKKVFVIPEAARSAFDKQAIDLRDKRVVVFDDTKLTALEISTPELSVKLEKANNNWKVTSPIKIEADSDVVTNLLDNLRALEAQDFVPQVAAQSLGLTTPEVTIALVSGANQRQTIQFFKGRENTAYAHPEGDPWIYKIPPEFISGIPRSAQDFRQVAVLKVERFDAEQIRFKPTNGKPDILLTKNDAGDWEFTEPAGVKEKVAAYKVYDFLNVIANLKAVKFLDVQPPESEMELKSVLVLYKAVPGKDNKKTYEETGKLWLGKNVEGGLRYARGSGQAVLISATEVTVPAEPKDLSAQGGPASATATPEHDEDE